MKLVLLVVCIIVALLIVFVMLYHTNSQSNLQRKSAQFKKDVLNRVHYAVHLGDDTFILDKQDKLLVYQKSAKNPEKFLPPQVIGLPSSGDFISIIPFGGLPSEGCCNYLTLRENGYNAKFISHDAPMLIYRSEKDDHYYLKLNGNNQNASRFQGKIIEDEIALDQVLTKDSSHATLFELCGSPLAFVLLPGDEPETEPQKADLNNIETEPPKRSMGDKIQDLFHQADAAPKKQSRPTFKN